jgi:phage portal protein BeeE
VEKTFPNEADKATVIREAMTAYLLLSGNSYIKKAGPVTGPNAGRPTELHTVRPDRVSIVPGGGLGGRRFSKQQIAVVYGVPPELIGDSQSKTYNSYPEARLAFYMETVLPFLDRLRDCWNASIVAPYGTDLWLDYDRDQIDALQEDRKSLWSRAKEADWLTINEKRELTGYDDAEGGDVILVSSALIPLGMELTTPEPGHGHGEGERDGAAAAGAKAETGRRVPRVIRAA